MKIKTAKITLCFCVFFSFMHIESMELSDQKYPRTRSRKRSRSTSHTEESARKKIKISESDKRKQLARMVGLNPDTKKEIVVEQAIETLKRLTDENIELKHKNQHDEDRITSLHTVNALLRQKLHNEKEMKTYYGICTQCSSVRTKQLEKFNIDQYLTDNYK